VGNDIAGNRKFLQTAEIASNVSGGENRPWQLAEGRASGPEDVAAMPRSNRGAVVDRPEKWALAGAPLRLANRFS
jgi:hypothetical protein